MTTRTFEPLYYADRLRIVNPGGDVGLVTLWTPRRAAERLLAGISEDLLSPASSRVAVVSNLYGDGLHAMLCNLLYNPQVRHLVAIGQSLGGSTCQEIEAFLAHGCEDATLLGRPMRRIRGTDRFLPTAEGFDEDRLRATVTFRYVGGFDAPGSGQDLLAHLDGLPRAAGPLPDRLRVDLPTSVPEDYAYLPSQPTGHQVLRQRPLDCWEELVVRVMRFGRPVALNKGSRLELTNVKAVISDPVVEQESDLAEYGFSLAALREYEHTMLEAALPPGVPYTYGNRLRGHWPPEDRDTLADAIDLLTKDPESRHAYISLWDTGSDLGSGGSVPCLTTLFFRRTPDGLLSMSATYRSHNLLTAWLPNAYGLMAVQRYVSERVGMAPGPLTVLSHSLGADPESAAFATGLAVAGRWRSDDDTDRGTGRHTLRQDPHGDFVVSVDQAAGVIVAQHTFAGVPIKEYRSDRAQLIEREVAADMAVSVVSHALWLGRELQAAQQALRRPATSPPEAAGNDG